MEFFRYFPKIKYDNISSVNITARTKIADLVRNNASILYDYVIPDGERPDILANRYYGHSKYVWVIMYTNELLNPLWDWPLSYKEFQNYIIDKYGNLQDPQNINNVKQYIIDNQYEVDEQSFYGKHFTLTESKSFVVGETVTGNISNATGVVYKSDGYKIYVSPLDDIFTESDSQIVGTTSQEIGEILVIENEKQMGDNYEVSRRSIVSPYTWESNLNEAKRYIKLIDNIYVSQIAAEFRKIYR